MKKCPTCQNTFDDNLRFCQNDGTALLDVSDASSFDSIKVADDDPLQLPDFDPMKTRAIMEEEQTDVLSTPPPAPSFGDLGSLPAPEPSSFSAPPAPDSYPPPIDQPESAPIQPPTSPSFGEQERGYQPPPSPFDSPFAEPARPTSSGASPGWDPPSAPMAQWENQGGTFGANTPFQPAGAAVGQNTTLAVIALVCGIIGLCCGPLGIAALITGWIAKNKADENPNEYGGRGMALAGMILGGISVGLFILGVILNLLGVLVGGGRGGPF